MQIAIKFISGIVAFFLLLGFPVIHISTTPSAMPVYEYQIKDHSTQKTSLKVKSSEFIFHTPLSGSYYSSFQYRVTKLDENGIERNTFVVPGSADVKKKKETSILDGKDGYLSYPPNGSFFLWYPKLGNFTFFYDQAGEFLWAHRSSHYMQSFPSGEYILAMTGDHSRAFFLLPDLSVIDSAEGTLLINYQFARKNDSATDYRVCLSFLDGDVVFFNPKDKKRVRINTGGPTKSIGCNFDANSIAVHVEENSQDLIKIGNIKDDDSSPSVKWTGKIQLSSRYNFTVPVGITGNFVLVLLPTGENLSLFSYDLHGKLINVTDLGKRTTSIDDWRIAPMKNLLIAWSSKEVFAFDPYTVFHKTGNIQNLSVNGHQVFIETGDKIISYTFDN